ncbi:MAG: 16S rRNA (adenine(1518)-N(6)/adenine(1519)-N(6))-dimethyltransferase RsmA [Victivallaceae bacterium]|nr:16S rRNA (adenine(1518)-N(6)/adenine(1519)-N(6))-dimethyltransferase RsmA [Victivallaceae bacterium]
MNRQDLLAAMAAIGMRPGRGLGQNFLLDQNLLDCIIRMAEVSQGEQILEVGPGFGALTEKLLAAGAEVTAIEYDNRLAAYLRTKFADTSALHVVEQDACKVDYEALLSLGRFKAVANLPYSISSVFIAKLLECDHAPQSMLFMLQREMGERLAASPSTKSYGALSVRCQLEYDVKVARIVPPEVFHPAPAVESALVSFKRHDKYRSLNRDAAGNLIKLVFGQRRKQMGKVLTRSGLEENLVRKALETAGAQMESRPDALNVRQFAILCSILDDHGRK